MWEKKLKKADIPTCITDSLLCTPETNPAMEISYTTVKCLKRSCRNENVIKFNIHSRCNNPHQSGYRGHISQQNNGTYDISTANLTFYSKKLKALPII